MGYDVEQARPVTSSGRKGRKAYRVRWAGEEREQEKDDNWNDVQELLQGVALLGLTPRLGLPRPGPPKLGAEHGTPTEQCKHHIWCGKLDPEHAGQGAMFYGKPYAQHVSGLLCFT